jgi:hypothetical protein
MSSSVGLAHATSLVLIFPDFPLDKFVWCQMAIGEIILISVIK